MCWSVKLVLGLVLFYQFYFDIDYNLISNQETTGFKSLIPDQLPVFAVYSGASCKACTGYAIGTLGLPGVFHIQDNFIGTIFDG